MRNIATAVVTDERRLYTIPNLTANTYRGTRCLRLSSASSSIPAARWGQTPAVPDFRATPRRGDDSGRFQRRESRAGTTRRLHLTARRLSRAVVNVSPRVGSATQRHGHNFTRIRYRQPGFNTFTIPEDYSHDRYRVTPIVDAIAGRTEDRNPPARPGKRLSGRRQ